MTSPADAPPAAPLPPRLDAFAVDSLAGAAAAALQAWLRTGPGLRWLVGTHVRPETDVAETLQEAAYQLAELVGKADLTTPEGVLRAYDPTALPAAVVETEARDRLARVLAHAAVLLDRLEARRRG